MKILILGAGAVVTKALRHGIPALYNSAIVDMIRFRESLAGDA
jgi:ketopantoate reductase